MRCWTRDSRNRFMMCTATYPLRPKLSSFQLHSLMKFWKWPANLWLILFVFWSNGNLSLYFEIQQKYHVGWFFSVMNWLWKASNNFSLPLNVKNGNLTHCAICTIRWPSRKLSSSATLSARSTGWRKRCAKPTLQFPPCMVTCLRKSAMPSWRNSVTVRGEFLNLSLRMNEI